MSPLPKSISFRADIAMQFGRDFCTGTLIFSMYLFAHFMVNEIWVGDFSDQIFEARVAVSGFDGAGRGEFIYGISPETHAAPFSGCARRNLLRSRPIHRPKQWRLIEITSYFHENFLRSPIATTISVQKSLWWKTSTLKILLESNLGHLHKADFFTRGYKLFLCLALVRFR